MNTTTRPVKLKNLIAYGTGDMYGNGSFVVISLLFMFFLTDVVGISPSMAGAIVLIGKFWDAFSDPLMGYISDNLKTRFGRRRVFFLIGFIPVGVSFALLWVDLHADNTMITFAYYTFTYILFSTVFTMVMIPYRALNAEMTPDYVIRTRLTGSKMIFSQVGGLIAATIPKLIIDRLYPEDQSLGFLVMGIVFGIFFAIPWLIVFMGTWETVVPEDRQRGTGNFLSQFLTLLQSRTFRIHMGLYISAFSALDMLMALFIYYLTHYLNQDAMYSTTMGAMIITSIAMIPIYVMFANRKGKAAAYIIGMIFWGLGIFAFALLSPESPSYLLILSAMLAGVGMSAATVMPWAMLPSLIDVDELVSGLQRSGICSGSMTLLRKMVQAVVLFILGILLDVIGYVPGAQQTPETLDGLRILFFAAPFFFVVTGIIFASRFRVTPKTHAVLKSELERLRAGGNMNEVDPVAKDICQQLSGIRYEYLYKSRKDNK